MHHFFTFIFLFSVEDFNPFKQRDAFTKLTKDPKTASFMKDPNFKKGLEELARDQNALPK